MSKILRIIVLISLYSTALPPSLLSGQEKEGVVKYTPEFRFTDGIYLNFDQVKQNSPIPKSKILTSIDYNDREFFKKILEGEKIFFYDNVGVREEVAKNSIWGYSRNGVIYVQVQDNFNRITFVAVSYTHLRAHETVL